jgi:phage terminase large subunit-like protein
VSDRPLSAAEAQQLARDLDYLGLLVNFPWHVQQQFALAAATNVVDVLGGTQSGKTQVGMGIVSRLVRREGPIYRRLKDPESRPLKTWVSPQTFEKYKSNWEPRLIGQVFHGLQYEYVQSPQPVFRWHDAVTKRLGAGPNELWGKAQEQGFMAFESDVVDLIVMDEEPADKRIHTSSVQRFATTNGVLVYTFTPLKGMTWTHGMFYVPTVKDEYKVADRVWRHGNAITLIQMGMADNPASVAGGGVARLQQDPGITQAEKNTRLYGHYGYAEGLIFKEFADLFVEAA